jgi:hypothetical protein
MNFPLRPSLFLPLLLAAPTLSRAQAPAEAPAPAEASSVTAPANTQAPWTIRLNARAWYVAPAGDLQIPGNQQTTTTDVERLNVDEPRLSYMGQLDLQSERWLVTFQGAHLSVKGVSAPGAALRLGSQLATGGAVITTRLEYTPVFLTAGYRVFEHRFDPDSDAKLTVHAVGGLAVHDLSIDARSSDSPVSQSNGETFFQGRLGVRSELQLLSWFAMEFDLAGGLGSNSTSFDLAAAFRIQPTSWFDAHLGYRNIFLNAREGDTPNRFEYEGSFAGLFGGVTLRF